MTAETWTHFFTACKTHGLYGKGGPLALLLLANPGGVMNTSLPEGTDDVQRLGRWRRRKQWIDAVQTGWNCDGARIVRYTATPAMRADLGLIPPAWAQRMMACMRRWKSSTAAAGLQDGQRLLVLLALVAACDEAAGYAGDTHDLESCAWLGTNVCYRDAWRTLERLGCVIRHPALEGDPRRTTGRYFITEFGRRCLGLPAPAADSSSGSTPQPYMNRNAA